MNIFDRTPKEEGEEEIAKIEALEILAKNNNFACTIEIAGLKIGLCDNSWILPVLAHQRSEVEKFMKGEQNLFE